MHSQTCDGLPFSVRYVILTVVSKCRHAWVKHYNTKFRINLFRVSRNCFMCTEDESGDPEGGDRGEHYSPSHTAKHFHIAPDTAAVRHPLPTHIYPLSTRSDVTRVLIATSDVSSCMYVTVSDLDYNRAERCPRQIFLALTTAIAKTLIKHTRIRTHNPFTASAPERNYKRRTP